MSYKTGPVAEAAVRAQLSITMSRHIVADFHAHGAEVIEKLRKDKPLDYIKMVQAILEKEQASAASLDAAYRVIERRIVRAGDQDK